MKNVIFILMITFVLNANATANVDECTPNLTKFDVCEEARSVAEELAPQLPIQLNSNLKITEVLALGPTLIWNVWLSYDQSFLEAKATQGGVDLDFIKQRMRAATQHNLCKSEPTRAFIALGGNIQYNYMFNDGFKFISVNVTEC